MLKVVRQARRRLLANELLSQAIYTACASLSAFILLLLAGTQVLDWRWLVPVPLIAAAAGAYLAYKSVPSPYRTAQLLDCRVRLADTLSTAVHFSQSGADSAAGEMRRRQLEQAVRLAERVDVRRAVPYTLPRASYLLAVLVLAASSLFALRYGLNRRLDLKPPLAVMLEQQFVFPQKTALAESTTREPETRLSAADGDEQPAAGADRRDSGDASTDDVNDPRGAGQTRKDKAGADASRQGTDKGQAGNDPEASDAESQSDAQDGRNGAASERSARQSSGNDREAGRREPANNQDSGLLSKMKDAFQNLLSRMKPQQGNRGSEGQVAMNRNSQQPGQARQNGGKNQAGPDSQQDSSGDPSAETAQDRPGSSRKGAGASDARESGKQPGSGIGSEDGDKRAREAEQLAAMGKISEIIGKRSANITGQATVEVQSTTQQLRTPYAPRAAEHSQNGAEISRDEIPVALQAYVERYFEQLRKQSAVKK